VNSLFQRKGFHQSYDPSKRSNAIGKKCIKRIKFVLVHSSYYVREEGRGKRSRSRKRGTRSSGSCTSTSTSARGVARIFQRGVTLCQSEGTHQIVMAFSPPVVGCLLKKSLQRGGGGGSGPL